MNMFGFGQRQPSSAEKIAMVESEFRLHINILERVTRTCQQKCLDQDFREDSLAKSESTCLDRCVAKFFETYMKASEAMQKQQQEAAARGAVRM
ncbi:hypothetical protein TD95_001266 [Thielaviopsis punctulata]|uniref:Mitochondrial import inner membrane translocase subunit n=1 Tax=Thielaviopsis punctulata TaxID=72032 RepID=A0A0F4ZD35_9PEZI|nr:hypothetical protein TD95_001266 [Thielaviopsis punctulata]